MKLNLLGEIFLVTAGALVISKAIQHYVAEDEVEPVTDDRPLAMRVRPVFDEKLMMFPVHEREFIAWARGCVRAHDIDSFQTLYSRWNMNSQQLTEIWVRLRDL